jgi:hypothetical protein
MRAVAKQWLDITADVISDSRPYFELNIHQHK